MAQRKKSYNQVATLAALAQYRLDRSDYSSSSKELTEKLIDDLHDNVYRVENPKELINALTKQRSREDSKILRTN